MEEGKSQGDLMSLDIIIKVPLSNQIKLGGRKCQNVLLNIHCRYSHLQLLDIP